MPGDRPQADKGGCDEGDFAQRRVKLLQPPAERHHGDEGDERQILAQPRGGVLCPGGVFIPQLVARGAHGAFDLRTNVALGVDQQLFGGEQHLNLAHSRHLANGGFDLAGAGRAIHAFYQPAKACMTQRVVFSGGFAAAGVVRAAAFRRLRGRGKF